MQIYLKENILEHTMMKKLVKTTAACLVAAGLLAACGGSEPQNTAAGDTKLLATATGASGTLVAPYFATWAFGDSSYNVTSLMDAKNKTGLHAATLAFVVAGSSGCTYDDGGKIVDVDMKSDISSFQAAGGTVILSFGGASGTYLEARCTASQMSTLIDGLIQRHNFAHLDFDVEGGQLSNTSLSNVRNAAIKTLQAKYPNLYVSFTLPVMPDGLPSEAINLVKGAASAGVKVSVVNIMAMDYGYNGDMGAFAISAAKATANQLAAVYPSKSNAQLLAMVGITPMIGHNDDAGIFTVNHAKAVATFASQNGIPLLAYWDFQRDSTQPNGDQGSGVNTANFQFYNALKAAEGGTTTTTTTTKATTTTTKAGGTTTKATTTTTKTTTTTTAGSCAYSNWTSGVNYPLGKIVKYTANGNFYKEVNAGTNGSDGTDPTVSTWYWQPTTCGSTPPPPACSYPNWVNGKSYVAGNIVKYTDGKFYKASHDNPGYDPTVSTWYWDPYTCS